MNQGNSEGQKFALLIGVSECNSGFKSLRCPPRGVAALRDILTNANIGGFSADRVKSLINPSVSEMQDAIGELFSRRTHRDLVLLYFTGHGVTDERGDFFFTTRETRKFENGSLNRGTAVAASFVRNEMHNCQARRQVAILDCCFSGAFPDGVTALDGQTINLEQQLGGEGRAILTAATSTQYALEQEGEDLSVYTRYLVKGLGGGEAVPSGQNYIHVQNLYNYIREQLRTAAPAMSPMMYAGRDGHEIALVKALVNKELQFQQEAQGRLQSNGVFSTTGELILRELSERLRLAPEQVDRIKHEVTQPYREREASLKKYADALRDEVDTQHPLSEETWRDLHDYQQILNLRDEDVAPILRVYSLSMSPQTPDGEDEQEDQSPLDDSSKPSPGGASTVTQVTQRGTLNLFFLVFSAIAVVGVSVIAVIFLPNHLHDIRKAWESIVFPTRSPNSSPTLIEVQKLISAGDNINLYGSRSKSQLGSSINYKSQLETGINQFKDKDYSNSLETFKNILNNTSNDPRDPSSPRKDPEILILRNNSEARRNYDTGQPIYTIAAAVPLSDADGEPFNIGQQILFGIAQAQTKALEAGINLEVVIANDRNVPEQAATLAQELAKPNITGSDGIPREILAVIGHYSSTVTCAALPFYNIAELAVISPVSTQTNLRSACNGEEVFFRTTSSSAVEAKALVNYLVDKSGIRDPDLKVAIFYKGEGEGYSQDLTDTFKSTLGNHAQALSVFNLSEPENFNRGKNQLDQFNVLVVFPDGRTSDATAFKRAIELLTPASENHLILGSNPLYDTDISGKASLINEDRSHKLEVRSDNPKKGLVVAVDWFPGCGSNPNFVSEAKSVWGGNPTRVYAMSYEAVQVIVDRIEQERGNLGEITRSNILNAIGDSTRTVESDVFQGKTISFTQNGDRKEIENRILITPRDAGGFETVEDCSP